jgi:hypothetical protein
VDGTNGGALRVLGDDYGERWGERTGWTYCVSDITDWQRDPDFRWKPEWILVALCDPENVRSVLIDGNERALQLELSRRAGAIPADMAVEIVFGELSKGVVRIAKCLYPLWRPPRPDRVEVEPSVRG